MLFVVIQAQKKMLYDQIDQTGRKERNILEILDFDAFTTLFVNYLTRKLYLNASYTYEDIKSIMLQIKQSYTDRIIINLDSGHLSQKMYLIFIFKYEIQVRQQRNLWSQA